MERPRVRIVCDAPHPFIIGKYTPDSRFDFTNASSRVSELIAASKCILEISDIISPCPCNNFEKFSFLNNRMVPLMHSLRYTKDSSLQKEVNFKNDYVKLHNLQLSVTEALIALNPYGVRANTFKMALVETIKKNGFSFDSGITMGKDKVECFYHYTAAVHSGIYILRECVKKVSQLTP